MFISISSGTTTRTLIHSEQKTVTNFWNASRGDYGTREKLWIQADISRAERIPAQIYVKQESGANFRYADYQYNGRPSGGFPAWILDVHPLDSRIGHWSAFWKTSCADVHQVYFCVDVKIRWTCSVDVLQAIFRPGRPADINEMILICFQALTYYMITGASMKIHWYTWQVSCFLGYDLQ